MSKLRRFVWVLPVLLAIVVLGVLGRPKPTERGKADEIAERPVEAHPVTPEEKAAAEAEVKRIWADAALVARVAAMKPAPDAADFHRDLAALTRHPHRLAGFGKDEPRPSAVVGDTTMGTCEDSPGSLWAGHYVACRLKALGVPLVLHQQFPVAQFVTTECLLTVQGQEGAFGPAEGFFAMRPNQLQAVVTPADGLSGQTVYAGRGELSEYADAPKDRIVVLEFAAGQRWLPAFALGARAVIFIGSDEPAANAYHHLNVPASLPRYYVTSALAEKLKLRTESRTVTLKSAGRWEMFEGRNVIAVIRGTDPRFDGKMDEAIVLAAPLDSYSEVPELSPGARGAANCAALLDLAGRFAARPPRRDVVIAFFDGDADNHAGSRAFYATLYRSRGAQVDGTLEDRLKMFIGEKNYIDAIERVLAYGDIFQPEAQKLSAHRNALDQMQAETKAVDGELREQLQLVRTERRRLELELQALGVGSGALKDLREGTTKDPNQVPGAESPEAKALAARIFALNKPINEMTEEDLVWSHLERALHKQRFADPSEGKDANESRRISQAATDAYYGRVLRQVKQINAIRQNELDRLIDQVQQGRLLVKVIGAERSRIVVHLTVNLGDKSPRWTFIHGGDSTTVHKTRDRLGNYTGIFKAVREAAQGIEEQAKGAGPPVEPLLDVRPVEGLHNVTMFAPGRFAQCGAPGGLFGQPNLSLMTPMDRRNRDGQPCDVVASGGRQVLGTGHMVAAARDVGGFLARLMDSPSMSLTSGIGSNAQFAEVSFKAGRTGGASALMFSGSSPMPDRPARGAFVAVTRAPLRTWEGAPVEQTPPGFRPYFVTRVNMNGRFEVPPHSKEYYSNATVVAALNDPRGLIGYITNTLTVRKALPLTAVQSNLFNARLVTAVGFGFDRRAVATRALKASSTAPLNEKDSLVVETDDNVLTIFARQTIQEVKAFNSEGIIALNNAPPPPDDLPIVGRGFATAPWDHWPTVSVSAHDGEILNGGRFELLRKNRILEPSIEGMHEAQRNIRREAEAIAPNEVQRRTGTMAAAAAFARRVYAPLLRVLNDLVVAVVLLLLLAMPFAYSIERLMVGTPHIYRQIGWFILFFLATFATLYLVNPAFRIAATPVVIFLAFTIILLSALVIVIMTRKLQSEVRRLQGLGSTVHSSDVSRLGTMMAAVQMGISTMRRRPIRTLLTAVTVVLLTFTILTFASFTSAWGNRKTSIGPMTGPPRLLVRHPLWTRINEDTVDMLAGFLKDRAEVVPRYWVSQTAEEAQLYKDAGVTKEILVADAGGRRIVGLSALLGIDPRDVKAIPQLAEVLSGDAGLLEKDGVFLTQAVIDDLGVKPGDAINLDGAPMTLAGVLDVRKVSGYTLLEGSSLMPVDYQASGGSGAAATQTTGAATSIQDIPEMESAQFVRYSPHRVAVLPAEAARRLGGRVASINVHPSKAADIEKLADQVSMATYLPTYLGTRGGVTRLFFSSLTEASGWKDLVVPVVLGGLIIFATMLGSVTDREKEIYAFSALGLAPPHVASLFFAEASVYAVVGGMGGYLLGQIISRVLSAVMENAPTMNYSSTNAVVTIMVVMATVMVSTIYPALKASRSANPGIQRSWRIGKPDGDVYDIVFPFTVSAYDITGVVAFLEEHFRNFSDTALGVFATARVHPFKQSDDMLGIQAEVALAPFDLGVSQNFALMAQPSEIKGIEEIRILLVRLSGTRGDWQRANRVFINELRKQLLIWRSLTTEIMEKYRLVTLQRWQELPVEDLRPETFGVSP